jgi:hypothetical protein
MEQNKNELFIDEIFSSNDLTLLTDEKLFQQLVDLINQLILNNFERLIQLLYRLDVSEAKLKSLLQQHPDKNAGNLIAQLIIERQIQKVKYKMEAVAFEENESDEERW